MDLQARLEAQDRRIEQLEAHLRRVTTPLPSAPPWQRRTAALSRLAVLLLTLLCTQRAYAAVRVPNQLVFTRVVAAGAQSPATAWPKANAPVTLSATCIAPLDE